MTCSGLLICLACLDLEDAVQASKLCPGRPCPALGIPPHFCLQVAGDGDSAECGLCIGEGQFASFVLELVALSVFTPSPVFLGLSPRASGGQWRAAPLLALPSTVARVSSRLACPGLVLPQCCG